MNYGLFPNYDGRFIGSIDIYDRLGLRDSFKTPPFSQSLHQAQILILEILNVCLWLKFAPSLTLDKIEHFETASKEILQSQPNSIRLFINADSVLRKHQR